MELTVLKSYLDIVNSYTVPCEHGYTDSRTISCWQTVQLFAGGTQINKSHQTEVDLDFPGVHIPGIKTTVQKYSAGLPWRCNQ